MKIFNGHLTHDGYEIYESKRMANRPVFAPRLITAPITLASEQFITAGFLREQLQKCDSKLASSDYDGAIASARSLVEGMLGEIYLRSTGERLRSSGDLLADYKRVKDLLNLSEHQHIHEGLKSLIRSFNGIIQSIDFLSNKMSDRHRPILRPEKHHAKLAAPRHPKLVTDQSATAAVQDRGPPCAARPVLSAPTGRKPLDAAPV